MLIVKILNHLVKNQGVLISINNALTMFTLYINPQILILIAVYTPHSGAVWATCPEIDGIIPRGIEILYAYSGTNANISIGVQTQVYVLLGSC